MTTLTDNHQHFTEALMLAITAPSEEKSQHAIKLATIFGETLSEKDREISKLGIETALDYMRKYP